MSFNIKNEFILLLGLFFFKVKWMLMLRVVRNL